MTLQQWLQQQPFTLTMSSGFFGFFAHAGMLQALIDHKLHPHAVSGSSAGALIAGVYASGTPVDEMMHALKALQKQDFWDPGVGLGLLKGRKFRGILGGLLAARRVEETQIPCHVSVWDAYSRSTRVIQEGDLVSAIYASCAVPMLFQPIKINGRPCWDGGISDRPGLAGTRPGERIFYHHIASRSPWRSSNSAALRVPEQTNLSALSIFGLPRSGPNKMHLGSDIFQRALQATYEALQRTVNKQGSSVEINLDAS